MANIIPEAYADRHPLEVFVDLVASIVDPAELDEFQEFATVLEGFGVLDDLTPSDARHAAAVLAVDTVAGSDDIGAAYRHRADWIEGSPSARVPLDDAAAVATAIRAAATIVDPEAMS
jgi:hypothetical protein